MPDKKKVMTEVLDLLNRGRACWGFAPMEELPRGMCNLPEYCVVARGLEVLAFNRFLLVPTWAEPEEQIARDTAAAKALAETWGVKARFRSAKYYHKDCEGWVVPFPPILRKFVNDFDAGKYPELGHEGTDEDAEREGLCAKVA